MATPDIVVIGSINMDLVCRTPHMPKAGRNGAGQPVRHDPRQKRSQQAVAAARLDGAVHRIERIGDDGIGEQLLAGPRKNRVGVAHVKHTPQTPSEIAMILVDAARENSIVLAPGANAPARLGGQVARTPRSARRAIC